MSEFIVSVPDEVAEYFMAEFGIERATMFGYRLTGEIVRCCDCEHYDDYTGCCTRRDHVAPMASTPDKFCAWGERTRTD